MTSSALLAGFFNCIWRDVHTESFLGKKQPTHIVRGINHLVTRACVVSSVAYFFSVTNSICLRNADFQDINGVICVLIDAAYPALVPNLPFAALLIATKREPRYDSKE